MSEPCEPRCHAYGIGCACSVAATPSPSAERYRLAWESAKCRADSFRFAAAHADQWMTRCKTADAEVERLTTALATAERERDEWKRRRDNAVETCRFRHQDGLTAREWHLNICAAAQAAERAEASERRLRERVEALVDEMTEPDTWATLTEDSFPWVIKSLRALLAGEDAQ